MIEFFAFSWGARTAITFLLGICVLMQTLALVLHFYSRRQPAARIFDTLLELSILCEIIVFSLLYGQVVNGFENGFVVPTGHERIRIAIFLVILICTIVVCFLNRALLPFHVIPATALVLPIFENLVGGGYPWFFVTALMFLLGRSIKICVFSAITIRTNISALSVTHAIDTLHTGVLFYEKDGYTLLSNHQMQNLMLDITGKIHRNAKQFYDILVFDQHESEYKKVELEGQMVYLLPDGTAWMFTKTDIPLRLKNHVHISAADVSELWELTIQLQHKNQELTQKRDELKKTIANLHTLSEKREIENAKMRAHDILGQRLTVLLRTIQNEHTLDYALLTSLSKELLAELKADQNDITPAYALENIQQIFAAIGVDIQFEGRLPDNAPQAGLFVDIIREGSTNAVRHGLATQISIKAESREDAYRLKITNNGHTTHAPIIPGSGIGKMRKKVRAQGGNLDIMHHPLFTLSVVLPRGDQYE